ncbi:MAG: DNA ligase-associated DEXH box helicase, partial [Bradyrhizobium sp.]
MPPSIIPASPDHSAELLPDRFRRWFASRGWSPREHQLALLVKARDDRSALLIAPTGAGKTLAGFLPTLVELSSFSPPSARMARGGEGAGVGGASAGFAAHTYAEFVETPPTPDPSPPLRGGRGAEAAPALRSAHSGFT